MKTTRIFLMLSVFLMSGMAGFGQVIWNGNGDGTSWTNPLNWAGGLVPKSTDSVFITNGIGTQVSISSAVSVASILCNKTLMITNGSLTVTTGASLLQGALNATDGSTLTANGSTATITASGPVNITGGSLFALSGAALSLPGLTNYQAPTVCEIVTWQANGAGSTLSMPALTNVVGNTVCSELFVQASGGGQVLLGKVATDAGGEMSVQADGAGSVVDFSLLTNNLGTIAMEASGGGNVLIPKLASSGVLGLTVSPGGSISTAQFTNITGASFSVNGGMVLSFPGVTNYQPPSVCEVITWQASGAGSRLIFPALTNVVGNTVCSSLFIQAVNGGAVVLSNVVADSGGSLSVQCDGTGSGVDLSLLNTNAGTLTLEASGGGNLQMPHLTKSGTMSLTLGAGGFISTAQFTNITGASFFATGGAVLSLPGVKSYQPSSICDVITWQANGGTLDLSALTNVTGNTVCSSLFVQARAGGSVLLGKAGAVLGGSMSVTADGTNSVVDLSLLTNNVGTLSVESSGGGSVLVPKLANGGNINLTLGAGGFISTSQFTNITGASLFVSGGATLSLPSVINYQPPAVCEAITWQATGAGSVLSLPALTNLTGNIACSQLNVQALSGGNVSLGHVEDIHNGFIAFLADGAGSVIDLSRLSGMVMVDGQGSLTAQNSGTILFNNQAFLLANVAISIAPGNPVLPPTLIASPALTLYGIPGHSYRVGEKDLSQPNSPVTTFLVPLTNNFEAVEGLAPTNLSFTVTDFVANPALLQLSVVPGDQAQLLLFGLTNATFEIQSATNLHNPISWQSNNLVVMTNAFRFLPEVLLIPAAQFFRAQQQ